MCLRVFYTNLVRLKVQYKKEHNTARMENTLLENTMPATDSDNDIVRRSLDDPDAFSVIVERYWNRLFRYVKRISFFTDEDTEDILQEIFIKVYRHLNDFDSDLTFSTWVYRICRNTVIDSIRKKQSRPKTIDIDDKDFSNFFHASTDIAEEFAIYEHHQKVVTLIESLPLKYREVLVLKFLEDKSYEEISDILQIPIGTV